MENWIAIAKNSTAIWTAFIILMAILPGMWDHTTRLFSSMKERSEDFYEGHSYVNIFAELLRLLKVPESIIKARLGGKVGLPHFMAVLPPFSLLFGVLMLGMNISARNKK